MREKALQEMLVSTSSGAAVSIVLVGLLPGIMTKLDMVAFFIMFWFVATYVVWSILDWNDQKSRDRWEN